MIRLASFLLIAISIVAHGQTTEWVFEFDGGSTAPTLYPNTESPTHIIIGSGNEVILIDGSGDATWRRDVGSGVALAPTVADLDGDGRAEVILGTGDGDIVILNADGSERSRHAFDGTFGGGYDAIAAADITESDGLEIVLGHEDGWLTCMNHGGEIQWRFYGDRFRTGPPAIGDVDGDGEVEVVYGTDNGHIYCLSGNGFTEWRYEEHAPYGRSAPLLADADGDGAVEIYITQSNQGNTVCLMALDGASGEELWRTEDNQQGYMSNAVADIDGDGVLEIFHTDKGNMVYCENADGTRRWATETLTRGIFFTPSIADVDGDGALEVIVAARGTDDEDGANLFVYSDTGAIEHRVKLGNNANNAVVAADLNGDGVVEIYATSNGPDALYCLTFGDKPGKIAWTSLRVDSAMTGSTVAMGVPASNNTLDGIGRPRTQPLELLLGNSSVEFGLVGDKSNLDFVETVLVSDGPTVITVVESTNTHIPLSLGMPGKFNLLLRKFTRANATLSTLTDTNHYRGRSLEPDAHLDEDLDLIVESALVAGEKLEADTNLLEARLARLDWMRDRFDELVPEDLAAAADKYRVYINETSMLAGSLLTLWEDEDRGSFVVSVYENPWDDDPHRTSVSAVGVRALGNEAETVALSLLNVRAEAMDVRAQWSAPTMGLTGPAADPPLAQHITLRRAIAVPDGLGRMVWDALPELDDSQSITIPPGEVRQLWLTISTKGLAPGTHEATLFLGSLEHDPTIREVPITIEVLPVALPDGGVPRMNWSHADPRQTSDQALKDMIDHGVSVVYAPSPPVVTVDAKGNVTGEGDWTAFDAALARLPDYFQVYVHGPPARTWPEGISPEQGSDLYNTGFQNAVRAFVAHMESIGWGYERWAFYPHDEPWLTGKKHLKYLRYFCEQVKAGDPRARNYTDPTGGMKAEYMEGWEDLIDVWQCEVNWLKRDPELRAWFAENAKEFLAYEATDPGKNLLPLGYYRSYGWIGAALGIDGYGWWVYRYSDLWWPKGGWSMVYPNGDQVVPSRRWEAARDGLEDFKMLKLLREAAADADRERATALMALHDEAVGKVAGWQIGLIDEITRQTKDYEVDWAVLQEYRARIMDALVANKN